MASTQVQGRARGFSWKWLRGRLGSCLPCAQWLRWGSSLRRRLRVEARLWTAYFVDGGALDGHDAARLARDLMASEMHMPGLVDAVLRRLDEEARAALWLSAPCLPWRHRERRERALRHMKCVAAKMAVMPNVDLSALGDGVRAMVAAEHISLARARALIADVNMRRRCQSRRRAAAADARRRLDQGVHTPGVKGSSAQPDYSAASPGRKLRCEADDAGAGASDSAAHAVPCPQHDAPTSGVTTAATSRVHQDQVDAVN